jgi:hypothetical protein
MASDNKIAAVTKAAETTADKTAGGNGRSQLVADVIQRVRVDRP